MSTSHPAELQLLDYVEGCLAGEELRGLRKHVGACSACQETLRELSHAVDVLERLPTVSIPHDGMHHAARRNRRRLWMRALPILAIVLAAGAVVQELRPATTGSPAAKSTAATSAGLPAFQTMRVVAHVPVTSSGSAEIKAKLVGFAAYVPASNGPLVAVVDLDDLTAAQQTLEQSQGARAVTVLLIGVQGLGSGLEREQVVPTQAGSGATP
jgi:anti-sigma factor RsiW